MEKRPYLPLFEPGKMAVVLSNCPLSQQDSRHPGHKTVGCGLSEDIE